MRCFETYINLPEDAHNTVVVIGNFDGVHLGHQALLKKGRDLAEHLSVPLSVLTFEPHPRQLFRSDEAPSRITPAALKRERLETCGVDNVFSLPFDWDFASQSADDFVRNILKTGLQAVHVIVGFDFKFGQLRQGTPQTIIDAGLNVTIIDEVKSDGDEEFSSSTVRSLLRHGKIDKANEVLGWDWEIRGQVFQGDQRGRELGYPTANMKLDDTIHPAYGIYACFVRLVGEDHWRMGATNIGIRPMFEVPLAQVETFIFDFDREIYGQTLCVRPVKRLRGEAKFESLDDLIVQMDEDCEESRKILESLS